MHTILFARARCGSTLQLVSWMFWSEFSFFRKRRESILKRSQKSSWKRRKLPKNDLKKFTKSVLTFMQELMPWTNFSTVTLHRNKALWLILTSHTTFNNQSECFISAYHQYTNYWISEICENKSVKFIISQNHKLWVKLGSTCFKLNLEKGVKIKLRLNTSNVFMSQLTLNS